MSRSSIRWLGTVAAFALTAALATPAQAQKPRLTKASAEKKVRSLVRAGGPARTDVVVRCRKPRRGRTTCIVQFKAPQATCGDDVVSVRRGKPRRLRSGRGRARPGRLLVRGLRARCVPLTPAPGAVPGTPQPGGTSPPPAPPPEEYRAIQADPLLILPWEYGAPFCYYAAHDARIYQCRWYQEINGMATGTFYLESWYYNPDHLWAGTRGTYRGWVLEFGRAAVSPPDLDRPAPIRATDPSSRTDGCYSDYNLALEIPCVTG